MKAKLMGLAGSLIWIAAILFIFGTGGSLELDRISIIQILIQWAAGFAALIIGAVIAGVNQHTEHSQIQNLFRHQDK